MGQDGPGWDETAGMHISSPGTPFFPRNILFQLLHFPPPYFLSLREKKASLWGGPKNVIPGGSIYYLKHKHTIRSGFVAVSVSSLYTTWYRVVSVVNASICLSINNVHRFQMIFNCSCHRWFRPVAVYFAIQVLLAHSCCNADSDLSDAFTARMHYYLGWDIQIGEIVVAHVWFQCYEKAH